MTALTPGCDPDLSTTGAPFGHSARRSRLRSGLVLLAVVALCILLAAADGVPGAVGVPAAVVGLLCALVLLRRAVRLTRRAATTIAASVARAGHRSGPVPSGAP